MNETTLYSVTTLNAEVNQLLTHHFDCVCVTGEISNLSRPSSGHYYFSLKDDNAQIRCAFFRFNHQKLNFQLENGQEVIITAQVSVYEPRGDYQLIIKSIQLNGLGALQLAFDQLKNKLEKTGFFDEKNKKPLPLFPKKIGIITSPTGAALQDILKVLKRRFPAIPLCIYPVSVQGIDAKNQIVTAIQNANHDAACDVILLARGGGSLEDLWAFNEEIVAVAIFNSNIPVVTGIGHQTDFTIADFVADIRAPTPSAAAEVITPDSDALLQQLAQHAKRLSNLISAKIQLYQLQLQHLQKRLQHPREKLQQQAQQLDQLENQLKRLIQFSLENKKMQLLTKVKTLDALSPLKVLGRGFSITKNKKTGNVISDCDSINTGDQIITSIIDGEIISTVLEIKQRFPTTI
ncbi:MAG: exodeoxyribonuclease VII large subunit [Coxiellaceae bacterium]|nr:exodeoxyribonuclease VII large subunit [Coxiellaceae bacterium]